MNSQFFRVPWIATLVGGLILGLGLDRFVLLPRTGASTASTQITEPSRKPAPPDDAVRKARHELLSYLYDEKGYLTGYVDGPNPDLMRQFWGASDTVRVHDVVLSLNQGHFGILCRAIDQAIRRGSENTDSIVRDDKRIPLEQLSPGGFDDDY